MIRTGGGQFRPKEKHLFFSAGTPGSHTPEHFLIAVNDLPRVGFEKHLEEHFEAGKKVFLDSGIFNLTNDHKRKHGGTMDEALSLAPEEIDGFQELFDKYVAVTKRYGDDLWGYIELDQGGRDNKRRTRNRLHDLGLNPIPVYHPLNDGWDYFDEIAQNYDRMCFGNMVQANMPTRVRLLHTLWERHRQYPELWVHVLGMTVSEWSLPMPPDSCDSSSWLNGLRYPKVDMGSAMLRRQGSCDREWLYAANHPTRNHDRAVEVYRDEVDSMNHQWTESRTRAQEFFGDVSFPEFNPLEKSLPTFDAAKRA